MLFMNFMVIKNGGLIFDVDEDGKRLSKTCPVSMNLYFSNYSHPHDPPSLGTTESSSGRVIALREHYEFFACSGTGPVSGCLSPTP